MSNKRLLLIVDDDPMILTVLEGALASPAWDIQTAADALQAFMKARDLKPFLILTDVQMPAYGKGTDMVRALRLEKATASTPVVVLTGMDLERAQKLLPPGDPKVRLINKPPNIERIFGFIQELTGVDGRPPKSGPAA